MSLGDSSSWPNSILVVSVPSMSGTRKGSQGIELDLSLAVKSWDEGTLKMRLNLIEEFCNHIGQKDYEEFGEVEFLFYGRLISCLRLNYMKQVCCLTI